MKYCRVRFGKLRIDHIHPHFAFGNPKFEIIILSSFRVQLLSPIRNLQLLDKFIKLPVDNL